MSAVAEKTTKDGPVITPVQRGEKPQEIKEKIKDIAHAAIDKSIDASAAAAKSVIQNRGISDETIDASCAAANATAKQAINEAVDNPRKTAATTARWSFWLVSKL